MMNKQPTMNDDSTVEMDFAVPSFERNCDSSLRAVSDVQVPDVQVPDVQVPDVQVPDVQVPDVQVPDVQVPDVQMPDVQVPDVQIPDVQVPDVQMPDIQMPEVQMPDIQMPDVQVPDLNDDLTIGMNSAVPSVERNYDSLLRVIRSKRDEIRRKRERKRLMARRWFKMMCDEIISDKTQLILRAFMVFAGAISHRSGRRWRKRKACPSETGVIADAASRNKGYRLVAAVSSSRVSGSFTAVAFNYDGAFLMHHEA
ncbi:periaxin-like isoform X2 [Xyrauchen texanus]|uniref:periaxin-like isoform X2 n=1 Tax=Xyrauchen texanus TaxID=154827 RepID=UPI002242BDE1|nr:periaxin-like isoform X2 [Xyrauchen texanus]